MSSTQRFQVCVIGGGITGLACALAAARAGARVDIHEAAAERRPLPAHVNVAPNLVRDLVALGVGERVAVEGFPYRRMVVRDLSGRQCFEMPWEQLAGPRHPAAVGIAYDKLVAILAEAASAAGAQMHLGSKIDHIEMSGHRAVMRRAGNDAFTPDLVVLATGPDCSLRDRLFSNAGPPAVWPQRWVHTLISRPAGLDEMSVTMAPGGGPKMTVAPVDGRTAGLTFSHHGSGGSSVHVGSLPTLLVHWLNRTSDWTRAIAAQLGGGAIAVERPLRSGLVNGDWHCGNVLLAGDCAHVLAPQFGQSVAQGVEDAVVIGHLVNAARQLNGSSLGDLYSARRRPRAARVHALVELAARWDLSPDATTDLTSVARGLLDAVALPP